MKSLLRDLVWIVPISLVLGLTLSLFDGGTWWIGLLSYSLLLALGLLALFAVWRAAGAPRTLILVLLLTLFVRLGAGIFFSVMLPLYGYDSEVHDVGSVYRDASTYDRQSWELASSDLPLWTAFDRSSGIEEQYGGLTLTLSAAYRLLSPDFHRRWLTILLVALVNAIGVGVAWRGIKEAYGEKTAWAAAWILALYPESVLAGFSQIREPFLLLFIAGFFWGILRLMTGQRTAAWSWLIASAVGMFLFSPSVAGTVILVSGVWAWFSRGRHTVHWGWLAGIAAAAGVAFLVFGYLAGSTLYESEGPIANVIVWLVRTANWGLHETRLTSSGLQPLFNILPDWADLPVVTAYGVFQPLLLAALFDPALVWLIDVLNVFRSLGWTLLLPLLVFAPFVGKHLPKEKRSGWWWVCLAVWAWVVLASFRSGGDQWDNPRYRLLLMFFQALLAGQVWVHWRATRDVWFGRVLAVEAWFMLIFGYWYFERFTDYSTPSYTITVIVEFFLVGALVILLGGWAWDRWKKKRRQ